jgi:nitroreductase
MIIKEIAGRRSVRAYKPDPVSDKDISEIIKAAEFAPSGRHLRPVEYVIVKDRKTKDALFAILGDDFIRQTPVLIIPAGDTQKSALTVQDISIASGYIFLQAYSLGLGTVWKNINTENAAKIREVLGIPEHFAIINVIPLGYPAENLPPHDDGEFETSKIHEERF